MAITLKQAFALNGTHDLDSFNDLQEQCKNTSYFSDSKPINHLSSWEGYWYGAGYDLSISLSTTSVAATGGTITVTYTIKEHRSTGDVLVSGIKPTVTSTLGTVSNITTTNTSGVGTATITIDNNKSLSSKSIKVTVSSTLGGSLISKESTATQSAGYYTYGSITINTFTYGAVGAAGGTSSPSITYSQPYGWNGSTSGAGTINGNGDDDYTTYKETGEHSALTVNESTGVVTWTKNNATANTVDASRSGKITATVTRNGKTATKEVTTTQNAEKISSYGAWSFTVKANTSSIAATGGSVTFTISRPTRTVTYDTGDTQTETASSGTFALTRSNTSFALSTTSISMTSSSLPTFTLSVGATGAAAVAAISSTVTAAFTASSPTTGTTTKSITSSSVTRAASSLVGDYYRFSTFSVAKSSFTAATGTTTLSMVVQKRSKYTGDQYTSWATITPASGTLSVTAGTGGSVSSITYGTTSTCTITVAQYTTTTADRTITISGNYNSGNATSSLNLSQTKDAIINTSYSDVTAGTISNKTIPASGTTTNYTATAGNGSQVLTYTWASGKPNTTKTESIPPSHSSISATATSRGTTITDATTVKSQAVTWTGLDGTKKATGTMYIYQAGNYVTSIAASGATLSYANISAGATSASATTSDGTVTYTYSSTSTGTSKPGSTYGTLTITNSYALSASQNGFTAVNSSTGALTATNSGTTTHTGRSSGTVTRTVTYTWTPKSPYDDAGTKTATSKPTATCKQNANSANAYYGDLTATASYGSKNASKGTVSPTLTVKCNGYYTSGSKGAQATLTSSNYTIAATMTTGNGASIASTTGVITWEANTGSARTSNTATLKITTKSPYLNSSGSELIVSPTATSTQSADGISGYKDLVVDLSYANAAPSTANVTVNPSLTVKATPVYISGKSASQVTIPASGYSVGYTESTASSYASVSNAGVITWNPNARITTDRTVGITANVTCNSTYSGLTGSDVVTANHTKDSIKTHGEVTASIGTGITAANGSATVSGTQTLTWQSGDTSNGTITYAITKQYIGTTSTATSGTNITRYSLSGTKLSHTTMGTNTGYDIVVVTATGEGSKTKTAQTSVYNGVTSTEYGNYKTTISLANATPTCSSGTTTATIKTYRQARSKYTSGSYGSYGSDTLATVGTPTVSESVNWLSVGTVSNSSTGTYTATVTYNANSKNTSTREATLTANANSVDGTVKLTQGKDSYTDSTEYGNYKTTATLGNASPTCSSGTTTLTIKITRQSRTKRVWTCGGTEYLSWSADTAYALMPTVTDNVDWLSVGTVSASSTTGTYTATVTYNANSKNTSTRTATITASCNTNGTVSLTQGKDSYTDSGGVTSTTYGNWGGGAISFNSTTALSAAADSRTVTIQPWSRTKTVSTTAKIRTWTCGGTETLVAASSSTSTEYYTGTVAVSENGSYTSLSATSYTASSSAKTLTLTKSTCGATITSDATVTVTANPSTDGPATTTKSISQTANALTNVAISVKSGTTPIPYGGGTVTLQCKGTFTSGTHEVTPSWTGATNGTLSSTTAKNPTLTVGANSGAERDVTVSAKYPNDSTGKIASLTIKQAAVPVSFTLPIDFYVQATRGVSGAADCSFKCSGEVALGAQSPQTFSFNSGLIREYYNTSGSFKESKVLNLASLNVTTNTTNFSDYHLDWGFALHASGGYGSSTSSTIQYKMYWQVEKYDGTIYELMSTSYPKTSTNYVSVDYLTTNESQTQSSSPVSITNGDRIRITIVI